MHFQYRTFILALLISLFASTPALSGWDALKKMGSDLADQGATAAGSPYTPSEAVSGIKEVLSLGTDSATSVLSQPGGFSADPSTALSLPSFLSGSPGSDTLLSSLNSAATGAIPGTGALFGDAIGDMSVGNPSSLLSGDDTAITSYFENSSRDTLKGLVRPVVEQSVKSAGVDAYLAPLMAMQQATGQSFDPVDSVTDKVLDGMFHYIGEKEKSLRSSGGGASELLSKLF